MRQRWIPFILLFLCSAAAQAAVKIASVTLAPGSVYSAQPSTGTVTLTAPAGNKGVTVTIASSNGIASPVSPVTILAGQTSGTFNVWTGQTATTQTATITASMQGSSATATLSVFGPSLASVSASPSSASAVTGSVTGTASLDQVWNGTAVGPITVNLSSSSALVTVPASVSIAANQQSATFPIAIPTQQIASAVTATITATYAGTTRTAQLTITPCAAAKAPAAAPGAGTDVVWIDDALPTGMTASGGSWDGGQASTGAQSLTTGFSTSSHAITLTGATSVIVPATNAYLYADVLMTGCAVPREIELAWHTAGGWHRAYYGSALIGDESGALSLGALPSQLSPWIRVTIPAASLGVGGLAVDGFALEVSDGQAWADRVAVSTPSCTQTAARPTIPSGDTVWIEDALPSGATLTSAAFTSAQVASGSLSLKSTDIPRGNQGVIIQNLSLPIATGDSIVFYALIDECAPTRQLRVLIDARYVDPEVYWGPTLGDEAAGAIQISPTAPTPGVWQRYELSAAGLGLEGQTVAQLLLINVDGQVWWDHIGVVPNNGVCTTRLAPRPTIPSGDTVWIDDALPAGATMTDANFTTVQAATGTSSIRSIWDRGTEGAIIQNLSLPVATGDTFVFYALVDECSPTRQLRVLIDARYVDPELYWGPTLGDEAAGAIQMSSTAPTPGVWQRYAIPASSLGLQGYSVVQLLLMNIDGKVWFDHIGVVHSGSGGCATQVAARPAIPSGDTVWIDDALPAGATSRSTFFSADQVASGTYSVKSTDPPTGTQGCIIENLSFPVASTDSLVFYALVDECSLTRQLRVLFGTNVSYAEVYWGPTLGDEAAGAIQLGGAPLGGIWQRYVIPVSSLGIGGQTITQILLMNIDGRVWFDRVGVVSGACTTQTAARPSFPSGDTVWIDDALPQGATLTNAAFTSAQAASGTSSLRSAASSGVQAATIQQLSIPIYSGDSLLFYALSDECSPSRQLRITIGTNVTTAQVYWGSAIGGELAGAVQAGTMQAAGAWQRYVVPFAALGLTGQRVYQLTLSNVDGRVWFDRIGFVPGCTTQTAARPSFPSGDTVWIDDALPAGATSRDTYWSTAQVASGSVSLKSTNPPTGTQGCILENLSFPTTTGDALVFYALVDECAPTQQLRITIGTNVQTGQAFWGPRLGDEFSFGVQISSTAPAGGTWQRYVVPFSTLGIEGQTVRQILLLNIDGQVYFDRVGVVHGGTCTTQTAARPTIPTTDTVWIDDTLPAGATGTNMFFSTDQVASGTTSLKSTDPPTGTQGCIIQNLTLPTVVGDSLVVYALVDECSPTRQLRITIGTNVQTGQAFWGPRLGDEFSFGVQMSPTAPSGGTWQRFVVPFSTLGIEGQTVQQILLLNIDGRVWFDSVGKTQ